MNGFEIGVILLMATALIMAFSGVILAMINIHSNAQGKALVEETTGDECSSPSLWEYICEHHTPDGMQECKYRVIDGEVYKDSCESWDKV